MNNRNISYTIKHNLCLGCGICQSACPHNAIKITVFKGKFIPQINNTKCKNDKGCNRCYKTCPGVGIDLQRIAAEQFTSSNIKNDKWIGRYLKCFVGHSNNYEIRYHCASGGMVSQFLIFLLEKGYIDGAVVTAFSPTNELLVHSYIAHNSEEILQGKSSKYAPVSLHGIAQEIKQEIGSRFIIVGLPCHIQGFRKLEAIDRKFKEKIVGYFAIYCSSGRTFYLTEHVFKERNIKKENLKYFAYRDEGCLGSMVALENNGHKTIERFQSYYHPLRSIFVPKRCLFCIDHYGELGDVCFGDIHVEPYIQDKIGINSLIVRKQKWIELLKQAEREGAVTLNEISAETLNGSQKMVYKKKERNGEFINLNKILGRVVPIYDVDYLRRPNIKTLINYAHTRTQQFIGSHKNLWWLIKYIKKDTKNLK